MVASEWAPSLWTDAGRVQGVSFVAGFALQDLRVTFGLYGAITVILALVSVDSMDRGRCCSCLEASFLRDPC